MTNRLTLTEVLTANAKPAKRKPTKYWVVDKNGKNHTRKSHRVYTHAVLFYVPARPADSNWAARKAYVHAFWVGRLDLAHKTARVPHYYPAATTSEIVPVSISF